MVFDPTTGNLITNSEDKTIRIWNYESKNEILTEKKNKSRYWVMSIKQNGTLLAAGHDDGL